MSAARGSFERQAWIALTAVLATALAWTAVVCAAVVAGTCGHCPPAALVVLRALAHAAPALARVAGPPVLSALVAAGLIAVALVRGSGHEGARHA